MIVVVPGGQRVVRALISRNKALRPRVDWVLVNLERREVNRMPWINLAELLRQLLSRGVDPEDAAVYHPDAEPGEAEDADED